MPAYIYFNCQTYTLCLFGTTNGWLRVTMAAVAENVRGKYCRRREDMSSVMGFFILGIFCIYTHTSALEFVKMFVFVVEKRTFLILLNCFRYHVPATNFKRPLKKCENFR